VGAVKQVLVPDIGDFKDIPVIEVMVKPGDRVKAEDSLVTLESDKATMDVPAPFSGVVREMKLKLGDKVSEGTLILTLEAEDGNAAVPTKPAAPTAPVAVQVPIATAPPPSPPPAPQAAVAPAAIDEVWRAVGQSS